MKNHQALHTLLKEMKLIFIKTNLFFTHLNIIFNSSNKEKLVYLFITVFLYIPLISV